MGLMSRAAVMTGVQQTETREFPLVDIGPDAAWLKVVVNGICSSDWNMYNKDAPGPRILGHEMIGTIEHIGEVAANRWGVQEGDLVALEEYLPCGHCDYCRSGEIRSCMATDQRFAGSIRYGSTPLTQAPQLWGGYSHYVYMPPRAVIHKVPEGVTPRMAAMALPIGNGFQWAYFDCGVGPGKTIVIQGPGQQGLGCVIASKIAGADKIIVTGLKRDEADRFKVAKALGADHTIAVDEEDLLETVAELTNGKMADITIDTSGLGPDNINPSMHLLHKRGTLATLSRKGSARDFDAEHLIGFQLTLKGLRGHSYNAVEMALATMASGRLPLELMSTHLAGLEQVHEAILMQGGQTAERPIHMCIDPWQDKV
jgi:threonine dehydrogenase-like Zn-dependent dehydrogenase